MKHTEDVPRSNLTLAAANLLARGSGLAREIVVSAVFGSGAHTDAWNTALRVPQLVRELLAEGALQNALVPAVTQARVTEGDTDAWALANALLGVLLVVLGVLTLLFLIGAATFVPMVASGLPPSTAEQAVTLTRWLSPMLAGLSLAAFASGMLHARRRFLPPALAANALNLVVMAGALVAPFVQTRTGTDGLVVLAIATTLSGFVNAALLVPTLLREGWRPRPHLQGHPRLKAALATFAPALIGVATVQAQLLVETQWASRFSPGTLTALTLSFRLVQLPLAVIGGTLATTALVGLSAARARGDDLGGAAAQPLRLLSLGVAPCAVILAVLATPICALVFERGAFDALATAQTAAMLEGYAGATLAICLHRVLVPVHHGLGSTRIAALASVGALLLKVPLLYLLIDGFKLGPVALPLSHAVTASLECALLIATLNAPLRGQGLARDHAKIALASVVMGLVAWRLQHEVHVLVACVAAGLVYVATLAALRVRLRR